MSAQGFFRASEAIPKLGTTPRESSEAQKTHLHAEIQSSSAPSTCRGEKPRTERGSQDGCKGQLQLLQPILRWSAGKGGGRRPRPISACLAQLEKFIRGGNAFQVLLNARTGLPFARTTGREHAVVVGVIAAPAGTSNSCPVASPPCSTSSTSRLGSRAREPGATARGGRGRGEEEQPAPSVLPRPLFRFFGLAWRAPRLPSSARRGPAGGH